MSDAAGTWPPGPEGNFEQYRQKVLRLLKYLEEFVKLKGATPVLDVARYVDDGLLLWFNDLPRTDGVFCQAWEEPPEGQADFWLSVQKQDLPACPPLDPDVEPWVEVADVQASDGPEPRLSATAYLPVAPAKPESPSSEPNAEDDGNEEPQPHVSQHKLEEHPEVSEAWKRYLAKWRPWAREHARRASVQRVYASLYSAYQKQKRFGEAYELVVGLGLLSSNRHEGQRVRRHVVAAQAQLDFDAKRGVISLRCPPPPEGARLRIEDEFLEPDERPLPEAYLAVQEQLGLVGDAIWDRAQMDPVLRSWANSIPPAPGPQFLSNLEPPADAGDGPTVSFSPALVLRRRTARGTLAMYQRLAAMIAEGAPIPFGLARLVDLLEDGPGRSRESDPESPEPSAGVEPAELYFPLPANDQQRSVVDQLRRSRGVLVQGPPGTGKSQTIANLVCHLLANGKRVLVTSETARALAVLKEKIPKEVQPLCVSLLGADTASFSDLEGAVKAISLRHTQWYPDTEKDLGKRIAGSERELCELRTGQAAAERQLRELREAEAREVTIGDAAFRGTAATIAKRVASDRSRFEWLQLPDSAKTEPPLSGQETTELLRLLREFPTAKPDDNARPIAPLEGLPAPSVFAQWVAAEQRAHAKASSHASLLQDPRLQGFFNVASDVRASLRSALRESLAAFDVVRRRTEPWLPPALSEILAGRDAPWLVRAERTREVLLRLGDKPGAADRIHLDLPEGYSEDRIIGDARAVLERLKAGGRWSRFGFRPSWVRGREYLRDRVRIDGTGAASPEELEKLIVVLEVRRELSYSEALWSSEPAALTPALQTRAAGLQENLAALEIVFALQRNVHEISKAVLSLEPPARLPEWSDQGIAPLIQVLDAAGAADEAKRASANLDAAAKTLDETVAVGGANDVNRELLRALIERNVQGWAEAHAHAELLTRRQARLRRLEALSGQLSAMAPPLWDQLRSTANDPQWDSRFASFEAAWQWAFADRWLAGFRGPEAVGKAETAIRRSLAKIAETTAKLGAAKAWQHFLTRLTGRQRMHLEAWKQDVKAIGKGTGKRAAGLRAAARESMAVCVEAIPAWIMPRYRVAESFDPKPEMFDYVIVDEASQMGIEGLFLYGLAKQIVVVGDDEQISPAGVGIPVAAVAALAALHLPGIPFAATLGSTDSVYGDAQIRFGGKTVLREHFRCVPEIIRFSDQLCYAPSGSPLIPLRNYKPERLEPIVTRLVREGFQEGKAGNAVNRPEAQALVSQLVACARDPRYAGKTFGVISLLGDAQAHLIERRLLEKLGPEEMEARRLVCGDAYAFQGDERHVVFLSMVSAPNVRIGTLAGQDSKQRFNVAASRAQDQLWLFHSVSLEDLSDRCVRRRLLEYCLSPYQDDTVGEAVFESEFERHVYDRIRARGFHVRTQVPAGDQTGHHYRIDLVVEGTRARLAIECDGDEWHGIEQYEADTSRQRQLERADWIFLRVWASDFYRDPEAALEPLWRELDRLEIEPMGLRSVRSLPPAPSDDVSAVAILEQLPVPRSEQPSPDELVESPSEGSQPPEQGTPVAEQPGDRSSQPSLEVIQGAGRQKVPAAATSAATPAARQVPKGDLELLAYFEAVTAAEWADFAQWGKARSAWDASRRNLILRVSKSMADGRPVMDTERLWAARLHVLARRIGFRPHPRKDGNAGPSGQTRLPFDEEEPS